jgi:hypothetical protein
VESCWSVCWPGTSGSGAPPPPHPTPSPCPNSLSTPSNPDIIPVSQVCSGTEQPRQPFPCCGLYRYRTEQPDTILVSEFCTGWEQLGYPRHLLVLYGASRTPSPCPCSVPVLGNPEKILMSEFCTGRGQVGHHRRVLVLYRATRTPTPCPRYRLSSLDVSPNTLPE